jgi:hypothetical protein
MPKSIYFTDEAYQQITEAARQCGFRVSRGRGSQIALFVLAAANKACSGLAESSASQSESTPKKLSARRALSQPATNR